MRLRDATAADVPTIRAIYNEAVLTTTSSFDLGPVSLAVQRAWFDEHQRDGHPVIVAERDGQVVGWASLGRFRTRPGYDRTLEHTLYVTEQARGDGVGNALLTAIVRRARDAGAHTLIGALSADNEVSQRLHARHGFTEAGRLRQVGRKLERWLDVVLVQLMLADDPGGDPAAVVTR